MAEQIHDTKPAPAPVLARAPQAGSAPQSVGGSNLGVLGTALSIGMGGQAISTAALEGFTAELWRQASNELSIDKAAAALKDLANGHLGEFAGGLSAGLVFGFVSPVTDLLGLAAFSEQLPMIAANLARRGWAGAATLAAEAEQLAAGAAEARGHLKAALTDLAKHPDQLAELVAQLGASAQAAARDAGAAAARTVLGLFSEEENPKEPKDTSVTDVLVNLREGELAGLTSLGLSKATRLRKFVFRAKWADVGYRIGHALGAVLANLLLLIFSEGIGNAIAKIGAWLGETVPLLARGAAGLAKVGRGIEALEELLSGLLAKGISKVKPLEAALKPLFELLGRFQAWLRRLFGVVDREAAELVARGGTAVADEALEQAAPKGGPKPAAPSSTHPTTPAPTTTPAPAPKAAAPDAPQRAAARASTGGEVVSIKGPPRPQSAVSRAQEAGLSKVGKGTRPVSRIGPRPGTPPSEAAAKVAVPEEAPALAATGTDPVAPAGPLKPKTGPVSVDTPRGTAPTAPKATAGGSRLPAGSAPARGAGGTGPSPSGPGRSATGGGTPGGPARGGAGGPGGSAARGPAAARPARTPHERLAEKLGRLGTPRATPLYRGRYSVPGTLDPQLTAAARQLRASQAGMDVADFIETNVAVAKVKINGQVEYLDAANVPGSLLGGGRGYDSEQLIAQHLLDLRTRGATVELQQLYSERIPCESCSHLLDTHFPEAAIFFTVPNRRALGGAPRAAALMRAYGLLP